MKTILPQKSFADQYISAKSNISHFRAFNSRELMGGSHVEP